ncbi:hypothetical protein SLE2022_251570 [Rubroshorea leprosula]
MHALKDKVTGKVSSFFTDSRTSSSNHSQPDRSEARPFSKEGKSFSSYFSFVIPSVGFGGSKSTNQQNELSPIESYPVRWKSKEFHLQDESFDSYRECTVSCKSENFQKLSEDSLKKSPLRDSEQPVSFLGNAEDHASGSSTVSDEFKEATDQQSPGKPLNNLADDSAFITSDLYEFLESSLPNIVKGRRWALLYSTLKHGISLRTLIRKSAELSGPCLLIAGDMKGAVFGGMLECPLKPTPKRKYQGTNQTFVFTTMYKEPRLFRPTGANRYYYICLNDLLALGGGGNFALCLDGDLLSGTSGPCETFGNMCLAHDEEFQLKNVELWGFTHSSQYLT